MILNPGFETSGIPTNQPGFAASWTPLVVATGEETAEFHGDTSLVSVGFETFDYGWGPDPQRFVGNLTRELVASLPAETMSVWFINQTTMFLTAAESATFASPELSVFETFEGAWEIFGTGRSFSLLSVQAAVFGGESFDWNTFNSSLPSTEATAFSTARGTIAGTSIETFVFQETYVMVPRSDLQLFVRTDVVYNDGDLVMVAAPENQSLPTGLVANHFYVVNRIGISTMMLEDTTMQDDGAGTILVIGDPGKFWVNALT